MGQMTAPILSFPGLGFYVATLCGTLMHSPLGNDLYSSDFNGPDHSKILVRSINLGIKEPNGSKKLLFP